MDHGQQQRFDQAVCHLDFFGIGQIALIEMRHDISDACSCLIRRQRLGQRRIQDAEFRTDCVSGRTAFEHAIFLCDNAVRAAFTAGSGNGQDCPDWKRLLDILSAVEIPEVAGINRTCGDSLGRVNGAASAHRQDKINVLFPAKFDPFIDQPAAGIRLNTAQLKIRNVFRFQGGLDTTKKTRADYTSPAIVDQNFRPAEAFHKTAGLIFSIFSENETGRRIKRKIIHFERFPFLPTDQTLVRIVCFMSQSLSHGMIHNENYSISAYAL